MIINLFILAFLLGMIVMWATYGLFSAVVHLLVVIVSGALAFAFWELFAYKVFMGFMPSYAWGVGLLLPFGVFLIALRIGIDSFVRGNLHVPRLADQVAGGAVGAASGVLTAGMVVIGIGFLPLGHDLAGYRPIEVQSNGKVAPTATGGGLWIGVDTMTSDFFSRLSGGAFSTGTPMENYLPDVAEQAAVFRLAKYYDENISLVATPGEVSVTGLHRFTEDTVPGASVNVNNWLINNKGSGSLLLANIKVTKQAGGSTFDTDSILRLPPTQVRLNVLKQDGSSELLAPIGFSKLNDNNGHDFYPVANNQIYASSRFPDNTINFIFAVPNGARPYFILVRNTRLALPEAQKVEGAAFTAMVGELPREGSDGSAPPPVAANQNQSGQAMDISSNPSSFSTHRASGIEQTAKLPASVSKNNVQFLEYTDDGAAEQGSGTARSGGGGRGNSVDRVYVSDSLRPLRLRMVPVGAELFAGQTNATGNVQEIWLSDTRGNAYRPFAWVILRQNGDQTMRIETDEFRNNTDLPLNDLREGDALYVYWRVPNGITIDKYHIGAAQQDIGFVVQ